jgi:Glycosyltransferase like family 2
MIAKKMKIEAVVVCVDYADYLADALPNNLLQVEHVTVVTTPEDRATISLCARHGVRCLQTTVMRRDAPEGGPSFNKARAINHGLAHLNGRDWVLHLDADTVLPDQFRRMAMNAELDPTFIYGMDRVNCEGSGEWDKYLADPEPQYEWSFMVKPPRRWPIGARVAHGDYGGYCPIGFFQLWNPIGSGIIRYPVKEEGDMEHTDLLHATQWDRRHRALLPEGFCTHLVNSKKFGINWKGRKTPPWRIPPAPVEGDKPCSY